MCVCATCWKGVHSYISPCMTSAEADVRGLPLLLSALCFETESLAELGACQSSWYNSLGGGGVLNSALLVLELQAAAISAMF